MEAGDRETRMRNIRLGRGDKGRTKKKVCKASATERDGDHAARFQSERVRETAPSKGGMGDARGKDPPTQESRPLFGFKQGKGCKTRRGLGDPRGGADGFARDGERIRKEPGERYANVNFTIKVAD